MRPNRIGRSGLRWSWRVATGGGTYRLLRQAIDQHEWKQAASFIVQLLPNARLARRTARWELVQKAVH